MTASVSDDGGRPSGDPREFTDGSATVLVSNRQDVPVDEDALAGLATTALRGEGVESFELSVSFVDTGEMSELHDEYLGEPGPTDVLSFPLDDVDGDGVRLLGDVVICPAYALRNNDDLAAELRLLIVHGVLHLEHRGAPVGQHRAGGRDERPLRHLEDPDAFQDLHGRGT